MLRFDGEWCRVFVKMKIYFAIFDFTLGKLNSSENFFIWFQRFRLQFHQLVQKPRHSEEFQEKIGTSRQNVALETFRKLPGIWISMFVVWRLKQLVTSTQNFPIFSLNFQYHRLLLGSSKSLALEVIQNQGNWKKN